VVVHFEDHLFNAALLNRVEDRHVTAWRMMQSLMIREFDAESSSHQGKYRELPRFRPPWVRIETKQMSLVFSRVFVEIPYSTEQGIILEKQGIFSI
jgi:hypothetical protein